MNLLKDISVLIFLILFSTSCTHSGSGVSGKLANEVFVKNNKSMEATNTVGKTGNADIIESGKRPGQQLVDIGQF